MHLHVGGAVRRRDQQVSEQEDFDFLNGGRHPNRVRRSLVALFVSDSQELDVALLEKLDGSLRAVRLEDLRFPAVFHVRASFFREVLPHGDAGGSIVEGSRARHVDVGSDLVFFVGHCQFDKCAEVFEEARCKRLLLVLLVGLSVECAS